MTKEIKDYIFNQWTRKKWVNFIYKNIKTKFDDTISIEEIKETIQSFKNEWYSPKNTKQLEKKDWWLKELVSSVEEEEKKYDYNEETWHVILYPEWRNWLWHPLAVETLDEMISCYSRKGRDWSGQKIQYEFKLTPKVRWFIKSTFNIYKDTIPFSIITLMSSNSDELEQMANEKAEHTLSAKMVDIYEKSHLRAKDLLLKQLFSKNQRIEEWLSALYDTTSNYVHIDFNPKPFDWSDNIKYVIISDAHLGKKWTEWIIGRFEKLTWELIQSPEKYIHLTFLGDLWEQFVARWEKHPWTKLGMEEWITTEDIFMLVYDVFLNMLTSLHNAWKIVVFNWLWWNHDSFETNKDFDPLRTPAMLIYRLLEKALEWTNISINIHRKKINIMDEWPFRFIYLHWDNVALNNIKWYVMDYIIDNKYMIIISGDKHHWSSDEVSDRCTRIKCPALAWKWNYDENLWLSSQPWAIYIHKNVDNMADITLKRFK